jgi:(2R)-3-sulfolactate dehydrogenase (NADP+)
MLVVDAAGGTAQAAFDSVRDDLVSRARENGIAMLSIHRSFTAGEIGHYTTRLAEQGLVALMGSNSPALVAALGAREAVTGTNPLSFALPHPDGPRMFDQAASATAWVNIRDAADRGESIPAGWALTPDGEETTDAQAGMNGALLPFGGAKAGNIAFMVEMLAVLSGGAFSLDAPPFDAGEEQPGVGLFAIAIDPDAFDPAYAERVESHLRGIAREHGADFGRRKTPRTHVDLPVAVHDALTESARGGAPA